MKILFSSCHNYLDVGSGAAVTTREELLELVRRGHKARTLCGALFDGVRAGEEELVKTLGRLGTPAQRSRTTVEVGGARLTFNLYRFVDSGIDSTVFIPLDELGCETNWRVEAISTTITNDQILANLADEPRFRLYGWEGGSYEISNVVLIDGKE